MRTVYQADALIWLKENGPFPGAAFISSLPDYSEFPMLSLEEWKQWFIQAAGAILTAAADDSVVIFYQRDAKLNGEWIDKGFLCQQAALASGHNLLWHKIVCRAPAGNITFGKPAYSHLLCFSKKIRVGLESSTPDILAQAGKVTWARGMGVEACKLACKFIKKHTNCTTIIDPFCGHGTVLAVADSLGFSTIGVELSRKRAEKARSLTMASLH
jgi:hypothetical protein